MQNFNGLPLGMPKQRKCILHKTNVLNYKKGISELIIVSDSPDIIKKTFQKEFLSEINK
jgi:hypothetical protein